MVDPSIMQRLRAVEDKLIAEHERDAFTSTIDGVTVTLDGGKETVSAAIRGQT